MRLFCLAVLFALVGCATVPQPEALPGTCRDDAARLKARSEEIQRLLTADQKDREEPIDWATVLPRDEARRKRIGEIFGEGCITEARDFAGAAMIYQHGTVPEHFFQTFLWAKKAVELGDPKQKWLMAAGLDRYLMNSGHQQLFGTQASKINTADKCWCFEEVEKSFPEAMRLEYAGKSLTEARAWIDTLNRGDTACKPVPICAKNLKPTPRGSVPGFW